MLRFWLIQLLIWVHLMSYGQINTWKSKIDSLRKVVQPIHNYKVTPTSAVALNTLAEALIKEEYFDEAMAVAQVALKHATQSNQKQQVSLSQFHIGSALQKKELYFEAVQYFEEAIQIAKQANNDSLQAVCHHWAAISYDDQKVYRKARYHLYQEEYIAKSNKLYHQLGYCYNTTGLHFTHLNQSDSALYYFQKGLVIAQQQQMELLTPAALKNVGRAYLSLGKDQLGIAYIKQSAVLFEQSSQAYIRTQAIYSYYALAVHFANKNQYKLSNQYANKGLTINRKAQYTDLQQDLTKTIYENYKSLNRLDSAIYFLELYQEATQKAHDNLLQQQHAALEERVKNEQHQNQIALLNQEKIAQEREQKLLTYALLAGVFFMLALLYLNRTIGKQKATIEQANNQLEEKVQKRTQELENALHEVKNAMLKGQTIERKRVASELHDNLGSLLSAIGVGIEAVNENNFSERERRIFQNLQRQISSAYQEVRLLSHNLQPAELESKGLKKALENLIQQINQTQRLTIRLEANQLINFAKDIELALYSICLELVNNILKHAKATEATIRFDQLSANRWQLIIADNGIGLNTNQQAGFGSKSVENRAQQIGAKVQVINNKGLTYLIEFAS